MSEEQAPEIQINVKGPSELKLQISITTDKSVLELKEAIAAKSDVEAERQRLIYSGRVLKDDDLLSVYKIQSGHTIHMVKGVARSAGASSSTSAPAPQIPAMQTGQNVHDPLTQLNSHLGFGAMAGLNPFADMGMNQNDPNMLQSMLNSPQFLQQMSAMMSNPAIIDQVIAMNPQLAAMGPQVRQAFQDEGFRQMISNPETLQQMMRMSAALRGGGLGGGGPFGGGAPSFPAPGDPNASTNTPSSPTSNTTSPTSAGGQAPPVNPFTLFGSFPLPPGAGATSPGAGNTSPGDTPNPFGTANPFGMNPAMMQQMLGMGSPYGPGAGGLGGYEGFGGAPPPPADPRPPEERFQVQLQQLQDMGFTNAAQNVRALLATGGNVQGAVDYIFSNGGLT